MNDTKSLSIHWQNDIMRAVANRGFENEDEDRNERIQTRKEEMRRMGIGDRQRLGAHQSESEEISRLLQICTSSLTPQTNHHHRRHILLNSSDIFFTAQSIAATETGRQNHGLRLNARELALVLGREQGGSDESLEGATRLVIGTRPSPTNSIWKHWESAGFKVAVVTSPHSNRPHRHEPLPHEEGDKALTDYLLKTAEDLLLLQTHGGREQGETLVLCIGKSLERFREIIRTAVRIGWKVEIWSWKQFLPEISITMSRNHPRQVTLHELDPFSDRILYGRGTAIILPPSQVQIQPPTRTAHLPHHHTSSLVSTGLTAATPPTPGSNPKTSSSDCVICLDEPRSHLLVPCFHLIACSKCIGHFSPGKVCPVCRAVVVETKEVYTA
jgi:hypothetical protein